MVRVSSFNDAALNKGVLNLEKKYKSEAIEDRLFSIEEEEAGQMRALI